MLTDLADRSADRPLAGQERRLAPAPLRQRGAVERPYDEAGRSLGLSADEAPEQPTDTIRFDSIRRFKGLEREVVVLVELGESDQRLGQLMYVGATRTRRHLLVIGR